MTPQPLEPVLDFARRLGAAAGDDAPDGELLRRFARNNDAVAFEQLLRRHGPMVRGVCRRVLRDGNDVDDAFQATFLLLVRKASGLRKPDRLGPWLHGVALRTARKARERTTRRREGPVAVEPTAAPMSDEPDWRAALDAAVAHLPARERTAVVMCYLDGVTYAEAAQRLRCPLGTLAARLSRARDRLRARLTRDGLAPSAEALPLALAGESVPPALITATVRGATALRAGAAAGVVPASVLTLMEGVQRAMLMNTWKVALAVLVVLGATGGGVGVLVARSGAPAHVADAPDQPSKPPRVAANNAPPGKLAEQAKSVPLVLLQQEPPTIYRFEPGDVLGIYIEGVLGEKDRPPPISIPQATVVGQSMPPPSVGYPIFVQADGTISLPLIEPMSVKGKSAKQVEDTIKEKYVSQNIMVGGKARVLVSVFRPRTYRVTIVRRDVAVAAPSQSSSVSLELSAYENDVFNALARSGGIPAEETHATVTIQRRGRPMGPGPPQPPDGFGPTSLPPPPGGVGGPPGSPSPPPVSSRVPPSLTEEIRIPLRAGPGVPMPKEADVILQNGDVVIVESHAIADKPNAGPADKAPILTFAVASPDGRVLIQMPGAGGAGPWQLFDAAKVTATESDGRAVDAKSLAERLRTMTTVLVATDGRAPTAAHLQVVKPGTLVLTVQSTH
ncbi:MAG TPA: sigma-70 family RNA polymerase sigma factor [Gemmataceae bacterium]|nr:sigma-70 family RNA polymerase sigma factor [Gemmataceae bacterium]